MTWISFRLLNFDFSKINLIDKVFDKQYKQRSYLIQIYNILILANSLQNKIKNIWKYLLT